MRKKLTFILWLVAMVAMGDSKCYNIGRWTLDVNEENKTVDIGVAPPEAFADLLADGLLMQGVGARAWIDGAEEPLTSQEAQTMVAEESGDGVSVVYAFADGTRFVQTFGSLLDGEFLTVALEVSREGSVLQTNRMEPLFASQVADALPMGTRNRMVRMPWDNDAWVRFEQYSLNRQMDSFNVTALFNGSTQQGLVAGAIDHDVWKNVVHVVASGNRHIDELAFRSGFTSDLTRDKRSHGSVEGQAVRSARFVLGLADDWRRGMEAYAACCNTVNPRRESDFVPVGWNSWGVMQTKISYNGIVDVGDFMRTELRPAGFHDKNGKLVLSLDSWWNDNLSEAQVRSFVRYCQENDFIPGLYYTPFADFATWDHELLGTNYTSQEVWLRVNGEPLSLDGAYALDPTHPGTLAQMRMKVRQFLQWGIEYLKCDFMSHAALEADSWYDATVTTGMQAYNKGMQQLRSLLGDGIFIDMSISPIFPYHYADGRRICCDTFGSISETQYAMNALSMGWWMDGLYAASDPDHLVLHRRNANAGETDGENRARITSGVITGMYLCGDNFSDRVDCGYPEASRTAAKKWMTNADVNEIPRKCRSFWPINGLTTNSDGAANVFAYCTAGEAYVAVINYSSSRLSGTVRFQDLGIEDADVQGVKELWMQEQVNVATAGAGFNYDVPARDARIYRIGRLADGLSMPTASRAGAAIEFVLSGDRLTATLPEGEALPCRLTLLTPEGTTIASSRQAAVCLEGLAAGVYLAKAEMKDGPTATMKFCRK